MSASYIPVIDFAPARAGEVARVGAQIGEAFTGSGFCYLSGHGVPQAVIDEAARQALAFFRLPQAEKERSRPLQSVRGFNALGRTQMKGAAQPDYKEYYQIGLELGPDHPLVLAGQPLRGPNVWPAAPAGFRPTFERYFAEIALCGAVLLRAVAASLGAPEAFFEGKYERPLQRTQAVYYPPHPPAHEGELFGVAPHTDYGCVTLLWQDDVGGLEVMDRAGGWVAAPPIEGTLVVNIGDLLHRWSNDRYVSTRHRVTNRSGRERLSIATFFDPDFEALVDPAELGLAAGETTRHPPVRAGDYIMGRIGASQAHLAAAAADA